MLFDIGTASLEKMVKDFVSKLTDIDKTAQCADWTFGLKKPKKLNKPNARV